MADNNNKKTTSANNLFSKAYNLANKLDIDITKPVGPQVTQKVNEELEKRKEKFDKSQGVVKNATNLGKNALLDLGQQVNSALGTVLDPTGTGIYSILTTPQRLQEAKEGYNYYKNNPDRIVPDLGQAAYQYPATTAMLVTGAVGGAKGVAGAGKNVGKIKPVNRAQVAEQIKPKTEVNIPSIPKGKTTEQVANSGIKKSLGGDNIKNNPMEEITDLKAYQTMVENKILPKRVNTKVPSLTRQDVRQAEINKLAKRESDLQQIRDSVNSIDTGESNIDPNLVNMNDLLPQNNDISLYNYFSKINPEAYSRTEYSPYTASYLIDKYARSTGISPEQALNIYENNTNLVWSLDNATGSFIPSKDNGFIRVLNPEAYKWFKSDNPKNITYSGITGGNETLLNTILHENAHKLMVDLNAKIANGEITPEGAEFLRRYNGLSPQGSRSESISHAVGSIPLEGDLQIPKKRIESYNIKQPGSEFSNESFINQRNMLSNEIRQRAIDYDFGLTNKEFESNVDKYLNGLGVDRFGGTTW